MNTFNEQFSKTEPEDEEIKEIMDDYGLDRDEADRVQEIMDDYGLDVDDAVMIEECE